MTYSSTPPPSSPLITVSHPPPSSFMDSSPLHTPSPPHTSSTTASSTIYLHNLYGNKLTCENYNTWKATLALILKGHSLYGFVDGSNPCQSSIISTPSDTGAIVAQNPAYMAWNLQDQLIIGALLASLT
jgi:hypothetical protein